MVTRTSKLIRFQDYRFNLSASKDPKVTMSGRELLAFARNLMAYKGTQAWQTAATKAGLLQINFHANYKIAGPFLVDAAMKRQLDRVDFSAFKGESFRELELFINDRVDQSFEIVIFYLENRPAGFIMAANDSNMAYVKKTFIERSSRLNTGIKRPI